VVEGGSVKIVVMSDAAYLKKYSIFTFWKDTTVGKQVTVSTCLFIFFLKINMSGICSAKALHPLSIFVPHEVPTLIVVQA